MSIKSSIWRSFSAILALGLLVSACNLPGASEQFSPPEQTATAGVVATHVEQTLRAESGDQGDGSPEPVGGESSASTNAADASNTAASTEAAAATTTPSPTVGHQTAPGSPGPTDKYITDRSTRPYASEQRAIADNFDLNILERPYTSQDMEYKPWLDITRAEMSSASSWIYVVISVEEAPPEDSEARFGVELDLDIDGRGDWLIWGANPPTTDWTVAQVTAQQDDNNDVGGDQPMRAEGPAAAGDGYERQVFDGGRGNDPDTAWIRRSPSTDGDIQLAFKYSLIANTPEFLWGAWTDNGLKQRSEFDYHDSLTVEEAGSPVGNSQYYPVKQLAEVDNTCRWAYGFDPTRNLPGMCDLPATPTPTATPEKYTYTISGIVYFDRTSNGQYDGNDDGQSGATVSLHRQSCARTASETVTTGSSGTFSWSGLAPGTWCVTLDSNPGGFPVNTTSRQQSFNLTSDRSVNFGVHVGS